MTATFMPFFWSNKKVIKELQAITILKHNITIQSTIKEHTSLLIDEKSKLNLSIKSDKLLLAIKEKENESIFIKGE